MSAISYRPIHVIPNSTEIAPSRSKTFVGLEIKKTPAGYNGLFAKAPIAKGQIIGRDGGVVLDSVKDIPDDLRYAVLIDEGLFLSPVELGDGMDALCYFNHSCDSNAARVGGFTFLAKRAIRAGEELTLDYAPLIAGVAEWTMDCQCASPRCRKTISSLDWKDEALAKELWTEWLPHMQREILGFFPNFTT